MGKSSRKHRIRTNWLIDPVLQLKIVGILTSICITAASLICVLIYYKMSELIIQFRDLAIPIQATDAVLKTQGFLIPSVVIIFLIFMILFVAIALFLTHKVAGPMIKLRNALRDYKDGEKFEPLIYRKDDEFQEPLELINQILSKKNK